MDRIKTRVSELFNSVFIEVLEADDGFEIVSEPDYDVLLVRAAIIDLDVTVPDTSAAGRSRSYTADSGAATLYIELYDSVSGQILGRAFDRQAARQNTSVMRWTNRASNTADARRVFRFRRASPSATSSNLITQAISNNSQKTAKNPAGTGWPRRCRCPVPLLAGRRVHQPLPVWAHPGTAVAT